MVTGNPNSSLSCPSTASVLRSGSGFVFPRSKGRRSSLLYYQNQSCLQKFTLGQSRRNHASYRRSSRATRSYWGLRWLIVSCVPPCSNLSWNTTDESLRNVSLVFLWPSGSFRASFARVRAVSNVCMFVREYLRFCSQAFGQYGQILDVRLSSSPAYYACVMQRIRGLHIPRY